MERQIEEDSAHQRGEKRYHPGGGKDGKISCTENDNRSTKISFSPDSAAGEVIIRWSR